MLAFHGTGLLAPHSTLKMKDNPLQAVCDCLFNTSTAIFHLETMFPIHNPENIHHAVVNK
jgi:hypothetical protein